MSGPSTVEKGGAGFEGIKEDLTLAYDREEFEVMVGEVADVGLQVHAKTGLLGEVVKVDDDSVTVDFDPERSGQVLTFDVEVLEIE